MGIKIPTTKTDVASLAVWLAAGLSAVACIFASPRTVALVAFAIAALVFAAAVVNRVNRRREQPKAGGAGEMPRRGKG